jgi:site-specific DNA recombinase
VSLTAFADELEREKAQQRTYDAMQRKARAGHVTGGRVFGYDNVRTEQGHVERRINEAEAVIVRRVFHLSAEGYGFKTIAKWLNAEGVPSPRAQQGRSQTWAPSSVRAVLHHDLYRGVIAWNRTRKRTTWGQRRQASKPAVDWIDVPAPHLAIVIEAEWRSAHARIQAAGVLNRRGRVQPAGRPAARRHRIQVPADESGPVRVLWRDAACPVVVPRDRPEVLLCLQRVSLTRDHRLRRSD